MEKKNLTKRKNKGITLIVLVITIIIILILAGITINIAIGDKGLIKQAQKVKEEAESTTLKTGERMNEILQQYANKMSEEGILNYEIVIGEESIIYDGEEQKPAIILKKGETVIPEEEYTVEYTNNINAGTGKITVTINSSGQKVEKEFTIEKRNVTITVNYASVKQGSEIPDFTYSCKGLIKPTDLKVKNRLMKFGDGTMQAIADGTMAHIAVGNYEISLEFEPNNNYNVTIIPGIITVGSAPSVDPIG